MIARRLACSEPSEFTKYREVTGLLVGPPARLSGDTNSLEGLRHHTGGVGVCGEVTYLIDTARGRRWGGDVTYFIDTRVGGGGGRGGEVAYFIDTTRGRGVWGGVLLHRHHTRVGVGWGCNLLHRHHTGVGWGYNLLHRHQTGVGVG